MPVGDTSAFSQVDEAIWAALQDTGTTDGAELRNWRTEQLSGSGYGKDFDSKEVPKLEDIKVSETPALIIVDGGNVLPGTAGSDFEEVLYGKRVLGLIRARRDEIAAAKKCKKFGELVWNVLADARQTCFGSYVTGTNPIRLMKISHMVFPQLDQSEPTHLFDLGLEFHVSITNR